ncbi:hypothetical protein [Cecembia sp.]|uniref:YybH family protein n=1 Tax=Cecembia sp. TaxID=1898110 RepID=UPI0025BF4123|nr:hypothetical protein [Cecembia sp.]
MKNFKHIFFVVALSMFFNYQHLFAQSQTQFEEINSIWNSFIASWEKLDASACASFYWEDAVNVPPQLPENSGKYAIEAFYKDLFSQHQSSKYIHKTHDLVTYDDHLIETGEFVVDWLTIDGNQWQYKARTMVYWKKNTEGFWKIKYLIFNEAP